MYNAHEITALEYASAWILWYNRFSPNWRIHLKSSIVRTEYCRILIDRIIMNSPEMQGELFKIKLTLDIETATDIVKHLQQTNVNGTSQAIGRGLRHIQVKPVIVVDYLK